MLGSVGIPTTVRSNFFNREALFYDISKSGDYVVKLNDFIDGFVEDEKNLESFPLKVNTVSFKI
jgi:hypothetical protein